VPSSARKVSPSRLFGCEAGSRLPGEKACGWRPPPPRPGPQRSSNIRTGRDQRRQRGVGLRTGPLAVDAAEAAAPRRAHVLCDHLPRHGWYRSYAGPPCPRRLHLEGVWGSTQWCSGRSSRRANPRRRSDPHFHRRHAREERLTYGETVLIAAPAVLAPATIAGGRRISKPSVTILESLPAVTFRTSTRFLETQNDPPEHQHGRHAKSK